MCFLDDYHESATQSAHGGLIDFHPDRQAEEMADGKGAGFFGCLRRDFRNGFLEKFAQVKRESLARPGLITSIACNLDGLLHSSKVL